MNASSDTSFLVDPNSVIKWTSDVFRVITLYVRRIDQIIAISSIESSSVFPLLQLYRGEYHRITLMAHPLDSAIPDETIQSVKIFTSQIQNIEYSNMKRESSSILIYVDNSVNTLFYGIEGQTTRGVMNIVSLTPDYTLPFSIFVSGTHDVGNKPFTFRATGQSTKSLRDNFQGPGEHTATGKMVSVNGTGFLFHENADLWSFRDGNWSLMSMGRPGNDNNPGAREGAMLANNGKTIYLFGGISTSRSNAAAFETSNFSILPISPTSYSFTNLKNNNYNKIFFYDVITGSGSVRTTFASITDPSVDISGWSGLNDVSSFFEKNTFGFFVNSFSPASVTYTPPYTSGVNPTGHDYQLEILVYPLFESTDTSDSLQLTQTAIIELKVYESSAGPLSTSMTYEVELNTWSNISIIVNTSAWSSSDLNKMEVTITCSNIFMKQGLCAIRDPELFVLDYELPVENIDIELYFGNVKSNPKIESFQLSSEPFENENLVKNDLWSMVVEPFFSLLIFSLLRTQEGNVKDRCKKVDPEIVTKSISNGFLSTNASNVSEGPPMFSDLPSLMFSGTNVFTLPSSGTSLRANATGDFTFSCTIEPRICKFILSIDVSSTGVVIDGEQPSHISSINTSNSRVRT